VTARRATSVLLVVALMTTGVYLIVYLFRWQWNRALICGVLFVATEVLIVGRLVLQRMRAIEERLAALAVDDRPRVRLVQSRPERTDRFAWLRDATTRTNVFLPLLLGAGVLASAAAWAVEALARRTARPALERSLAISLAPLAFPAGGFIGPLPSEAPARPAHPGWRRVGVGLASAVVATTIGLGIDVIADATQTRPDRLDLGATTVVDLHFRGARALADPTRHASDLVRVCVSQSFSRDIPEMAVAGLGPSGARVFLDADLGDRGATRLRGCLEDTTLERIQASVVALSEVPPPD